MTAVARRLSWGTGLALAALVFVSPAMAQPTPGSRVLVMPFVATAEAGAPGGASAALWLGEAASVVIADALAAQGVGAFTREERVVAFDRLNLTMSPVLTRATMIRVAELVDASEIVFGEVRLGQTIEVRARLVRVAAGREMPVVLDRGPLGDVFEVFGRVAASLSTHTGRFRPASAPVAPMPLEAFENYIKGLVATTPAAQQRFLESAVRQAATDARILLALWDVHTTQGNHERALASASAVPSDAPAFRRARLAVAYSLIELRRFDGAYQTLTELWNASRSATVSNALGVVQLRRGAAGGVPASTYFRRAVDADPENTDYLFNLGYAHAIAANTAEALTWLRETVRFDAADADAHWVMSAALVAAGRSTEGQREFELARLLGAGDGGVTATPSSRVPMDLERLPSASELPAATRLRATTERAQRDQEETAAFYLANGRAFVAASKDREATGELRRAIYLAPYRDEPHLLLGQVHQRAGRLTEAIGEFTIAIWCLDTAAARIALAGAHLAAGDREAARPHVERALQLTPGSAEAQALAKRLVP